METLSAGRVRSIDFDSAEEYEVALKVFEREKELLAGLVSKKMDDAEGEKIAPKK